MSRAGSQPPGGLQRMTADSDPHSGRLLLAQVVTAVLILVAFTVLPKLRGVPDPSRGATGLAVVTKSARFEPALSTLEDAVRPATVRVAMTRVTAPRAKRIAPQVIPPAPVASATAVPVTPRTIPAPTPAPVSPVTQPVATAQPPPIPSTPKRIPAPSTPTAPVKTSPQPETSVPFDNQGSTPGSTDGAVQFDDSGTTPAPTP